MSKSLSFSKERVRVLVSAELDEVVGGYARVSSARPGNHGPVSSARPGHHGPVSSARPPQTLLPPPARNNPVSSARPGLPDFSTGGPVSSARPTLR